MHVVCFAVWYEMIQATARAGTFVHVFEERALRAQYLFRTRLTRAWHGGILTCLLKICTFSASLFGIFLFVLDRNTIVLFDLCTIFRYYGTFWLPYLCTMVLFDYYAWGPQLSRPQIQISLLNVSFISAVGSMISSASAVNWHFYMDYNL